MSPAGKVLENQGVRGVQKWQGAAGRARQIPLLIGQPRDGLDKANQPIIAIDCVFNPWVITSVSRDNMFKVNTVELAMQWVHQDHQIKLHKNWKIITWNAHTN